MLFVRLVEISPLCGILNVVLRSPAASLAPPSGQVRAGFAEDRSAEGVRDRTGPATPPLTGGATGGGRVGSGWTVLGGELAVPCTRNPL
jgi:hypothetical protein